MKASIRSVAAIGVLALLLAACESRAGEGTDGVMTTTAGNGTTTSSTTAPGVASPRDLLDGFAALWAGGEWDGMADVAEPVAVATAEEWGQADWVNVVWQPGCELDSAGTGNCEVLVYPPDYDGYALIFSVRYTGGAGGELSIAELTFGGDAG